MPSTPPRSPHPLRSVWAMTKYMVDSDEVAQATANVEAAMGRIQHEVGALQSRLGTLQQSWSGEAAMGFQGAVADWQATQRRVEEGLTSLGRALRAAAQQYAEVERMNAQLFRH
jgi:6 kDa early secretory antigenic target